MHSYILNQDGHGHDDSRDLSTLLDEDYDQEQGTTNRVQNHGVSTVFAMFFSAPDAHLCYCQHLS